MSTIAEIEAAISRLPLQQAAEVSEWLEDQRELSPEFVASIERGRPTSPPGVRASSVREPCPTRPRKFHSRGARRNNRSRCLAPWVT